MSSATLNWGILSTGQIAECFANAVANSGAGRVVAVGSRASASAEAFAGRFDIPTAHGGYDDLLADDNVQAVYIATPHPMHAQWAIKAAEAGKHVLCEKPAALNQWQADAMIGAAMRHGTFFAEAFMYRCHPQTAKLVELLGNGQIGQVRMVRATFGFGGGDTIDPAGRLFANELGGGGIMDVGCYPVSMARLIAGAVDGQPFANPIDVKGAGQVGQTRVDEWAAAVLKFDNGIVAQLATAVRAGLENTVHIVGADGSITLPDPWQASRGDATAGVIIVRKRGEDERKIEVPTDMNAFSHEAAMVARCVAAGQTQAPAPAMSWDDTRGNLATLDRWRTQVGVVYDDETPRAVSTDLAGRPIRIRVDQPGHNMKYDRVPGLDKPVSKLIFGALTAHGSFAKAQPMFDHWLEVGGNTFDTGHVYGPSDKILGQWLTSRGVREDIVIVAKGAHTPHCNPEGLTRELGQSLDNLQTDHTDIYIMHRDNEDIPVGEFIDVLNEHVDAGRIKAFGGSNWSAKRFEQANAYAQKHGKQGMAILNNNLSLAEMVDPVWAGCIHMSDEQSRQWMADNGVVHFAWSSQARGFFTERTDKELENPGYDDELRRCWLSDANLERRRRAYELAEKKGCTAINIAAAFVLCQPFPSFALIGPEKIWEMDTSLPAMDIELSQDEIDWLWNG